ncbi:MAG: hypothetical protein WC645_01730 [Candidatus Margulisiibacteriota bacterium]
MSISGISIYKSVILGGSCGPQVVSISLNPTDLQVLNQRLRQFGFNESLSLENLSDEGLSHAIFGNESGTGLITRIAKNAEDSIFSIFGFDGDLASADITLELPANASAEQIARLREVLNALHLQCNLPVPPPPPPPPAPPAPPVITPPVQPPPPPPVQPRDAGTPRPERDAEVETEPEPEVPEDAESAGVTGINYVNCSDNGWCTFRVAGSVPEGDGIDYELPGESGVSIIGSPQINRDRMGFRVRVNFSEGTRQVTFIIADQSFEVTIP